MRHADVLALTVGQLDDGDALTHVILTLGHDLHDGTMALRGSHDDMLVEEVVLENLTNFVTASDDRAGALVMVRHKGVETVLVKGGKIDSTGHED
jgi:hypothetical protein